MWTKKNEENHAVSNELFHQLAKRNVRNSSRDYIIYFLTLAFSVALFYTFNSIEAQFSVFDIPDSLNFLTFSTSMLAAISVLVCLIIGFLIVYANHFMLRRRKQEMGVYMLLGMEFENISALLLRETSIIGGISLITGLGSGIILSQGLSLVTAKIIGAQVTNYHFVLSAKATVMSVLFFGIIFFFVYRWNVRVIKKMKLIELIYADKKNETVSKGKSSDILLFVLGVAMIITGYVVIAIPEKNYFLQGFFKSITFITTGSILLCLSISITLIKLLKRRKKYYYSRLHLFAVNQLGSRLKSDGISIGVTSVLICLAISIMIIGLGTGGIFVQDANAVAPYDVSFQIREEVGNLDNITVEQMLEQKGLTISDYVKDSAELRVYTSDNITRDIFDSNKDSKQYKVYIIGIDDYNRVMALKGISPVKLSDDEYMVNYNVEKRRNTLENFMKNGIVLNLNGSMLTPAKDGLLSQTYNNGNGFADDGTLIVPQKLTKDLTLMWAVCNGNFYNSDSYEKLYIDYIRLPERITFYTHKDIKIEIMSNILTVTYIGIYLGITFLIVASAVLALQQLSQVTDNCYRYGLLRKLGSSEADMKEALFIQLFIYFGIPFVLAVLNAVFIVAGIFSGVEELSIWSVVQTSLFISGVVVVIYGLYFIVTYTGSKRILKLKKDSVFEGIK